ncbi:hypothetical protein [Streptomyces sp. SPB074]|uniref:hypothetical protein n=1 Tax=Streptomyces sp. (strain SPB074) TaxID=465543 RepID=UPI00017F2658|nr:hypothetical protein [Streptomyces sp. SPB074]EDY46680.1 conserved hypothetical protein [Streptomyces sp. SPB074]
MARELTAAQRRVIGAAEPVTGRLRGPAAVLERLVKLGLAFRHPRPPHDCFLSPAGQRARTEPPEQLRSSPEPPPVPRPTADGVFAARTGEEHEPPVDAATRVREVRAAWQGLLELRRMTRADGDTGRPCAWERAHLVRAAALALEAAGRVPALAGRNGYVVRESPQPEAVEVRVAGDGVGGDGASGTGTDPREELVLCAEALEAAGWQVSEHGDRRGGRVVIASPPRR